MAEPAPPPAELFFFQSQAGPLFAVYHPPAPGTNRNHTIVHVPAFAEEMNKSRRMVALQSAEFARQGFGVLIVDLFGTGDSPGDFADASWEMWRQNLADACTWAEDRGAGRISLWALRMGALLAADFAAATSTRLDQLLLWHPVAAGDQMIMQFLRLRVAAAMLNENVEGESTSDLRNRLRDGNPVEVAGYQLSPEMVNPLMGIRLNRIRAWPFRRILLFEIITQEGKTLSAANQKLVSSLDTQVETCTLTGAHFWSTQEIAVIPGLIQSTTALTIESSA